MNEKNRTTALGRFFNRNYGLKNDPLATAQAASKKRRMSEEINRRSDDRVKMEMGTLKNAVEAAKDVFNPSRYELYSLYDAAITDSEVKSQANTAIYKLIAEPFAIAVNGMDDSKLADLLHRPWFEKLLRYIFWQEMYGYTLVEFGHIDKKGEFQDCNVFPRKHVRPDKKEILMDPLAYSGTFIGDLMPALGLIQMGDPSDLGVLETITREVIWKNFSRSDWATYSEKFGQPLITMNTDAEGEELNKRISMLRNFASSGWVVGDKDGDTFDLKEPASRTGGHQLFLENIVMADKYIGKLINGQTGTANNEAWSGTANVHERIMDDIHHFRLRTATNVINYKLIPFLAYWGYPLADASFRFTAMDDSEIIETAPSADPEPKDKPVPTPKARRIVAEDKTEKLLEDFLKRVYNGQTSIDPAIWKLNFQSLVQAILSAGFKFNAKHKLYDLATALKENAAYFSAFKNHREVEQLSEMLVDEKGIARSWNEFKKVAMKVTKEYNINWLKTEHTNAVSSAIMAEKWNGFEENAGDFPNLEYRAVMDGQTRDEHAALDGLILPINDKRWNRIYPPNGHNCRCDVTQTSKKVNELPVLDSFTPDRGFDGNPGKDKKLFSDKNEYQDTYSKKEQEGIAKQAQRLLKDESGE